MKLICQKCKADIQQSHINLKEGFANCTSCNEFFRIADFLRNDEEIRRIKKPHYSKVELNKSLNKNTISIPPTGWNGTAFFFLFFSLLWNGISWAVLLLNKESFPTLFSIPFIMIGILTIGFLLFILNGTTQVIVDMNQFVVKWSLFGLSYSKARDTKKLIKITEDVIYTKNYQPIYGIGLYFDKQTKVKFGSSLKEEERKWLIGELYEIKHQYSRLSQYLQ
jgi:hypothetical protein